VNLSSDTDLAIKKLNALNSDIYCASVHLQFELWFLLCICLFTSKTKRPPFLSNCYSTRSAYLNIFEFLGLLPFPPNRNSTCSAYLNFWIPGVPPLPAPAMVSTTVMVFGLRSPIQQINIHKQFKVPHKGHLPVLRDLLSTSIISNQFFQRKVNKDIIN
jgi:hypothetical protein